jgi:hypothetical protein
VTLEEAQIIAGIFSTADSGCEFCAGELADQAQEYFPQFNWKELLNNVEATYPDGWRLKELAK